MKYQTLFGKPLRLSAVLLTSILILTLTHGAFAGDCAQLSQFKLAGFDLVINDARTVPEGKMPPNPFGGGGYEGLLPEHCRIEGELDRRVGAGGKPYSIGFALALPKEWNGRFMFQGGAGLNGVIRNPFGAQGGGIPALARGFAVVSTDSGHKSKGMGFDTSFFGDQEALMNFLYKAIGKVTVVAKAIVNEYYSKPIDHSYYVGCSTGGREGMIMSQRFPDYFDGIVAGAPAMRTSFSNLALRWLHVALNQIAPLDEKGEPVPGGGLPEEDRDLIVRSFLKACDENDGIKDGMVFDVRGCDFDPALLTCEGEKTPDCLTVQQVKALHKGVSGPVDSRGHQVYSSFPYDTGISIKPPASFIPGLLVISAGPFGPPTKDTTMDLDRESIAATDATAAVGDSFQWTHLSTFALNGGKLIFYHGVSDPWFSALDTVQYYENLGRDNGGAAKVSEWSSLFLVPGMGHCGGGEQTLDQFDMLSAIVDWVEEGSAPESVTSTGRSYPDRSRPLCAYPKFAHYKGEGSIEEAASFECRE